MKEKKDIASDALDALLSEAQRITLAVHTHPDGDAVGSGAALLHYLREARGKDVALLFPDPVPGNLDFLVPPAGCLVFSEDAQAAAARIAASDLLVCLDCSSFSRTAGAEEALRRSGARKVLFDHHLAPETEAFQLVFSRTAVSSTCEVLYDALLSLPDIGGDARRLPGGCAQALMAGMTTDTNNFANSVFPGTLRMASALLEAGVDRDGILEQLYQRFRESRLRLMGYLLDNELKVTPDGVACIVIRADVQRRFGMQQGETEGFVNLPLGIGDVRLSLLLTEQEDHFRVSIRSKRGISANRLAAGFFHGGGHEQAAGGKLFFPQDIPGPDAAQAYILKVTDGFLKA